LTLINALMVLV